MAHPPHASTVPSREKPRALIIVEADPDASEPEVEAQELMRADGLTALEHRERQAAWEANQAEEAAIFERAASRLRPSWVAPAPVRVAPAQAELSSQAEGEPAPPQADEPIATTHVEAEEVEPSVVVDPALLEGFASQEEHTDRFAPAVALPPRATRGRSLAIAAAACVALAAAWIALSATAAPRKPAPRATTAPLVTPLAATAVSIEAPLVAEPEPPPAIEERTARRMGAKKRPVEARRSATTRAKAMVAAKDRAKRSRNQRVAR